MLATLCSLLLLAFWPAPEPAPSEPATELPLPGPPADEPAPGAELAAPDRARKLSHPRREPEDLRRMIPRAILAVPRVVLTGVFAPISAILSIFDDRAIARVRRAFLWNREETIGWVPAASFQSGYGFAVGARVFHDDLLGHDEELSVEASAGGLDLQAYQLRLEAERLAGTRVRLDARVRYDLTPRLVFQGIGDRPPTSSDQVLLDPYRAAVRTRYTQNRALAALRLGYRFGPTRRSIVPGIGVVFNHRELGPDRAGDGFLLLQDDHQDPSIEEVYDVRRLVGFTTGVDVARLVASLEIDSRDHRGEPSSGWYWRVEGGGAPPQARGVAYAHWGTELITYVDLFKHTRVLMLRAALEAVHGDDRRIPFTELPRLGGALRLRGYRLNRFRDRRLVLGSAEYRFPIHKVLGGHLFVDAGRVARTYREVLANGAAPWRVGVGGGLHFRTLDKLYVRLDLSYGEGFLVFFSTDALQAFADHHVLEL